jgi:hypothetical protein
MRHLGNNGLAEKKKASRGGRDSQKDLARFPSEVE